MVEGGAAQPGDRVELFGWGDNTPDPTPNLPTQLQQLTTKVVPPARCTDAGQTPAEICTDNPNGPDGPGGGDSGGPAVKYVNGIPLLVGGCSRAASQYPGADETVYTPAPRTSAAGSTTRPAAFPQPRGPSAPRRNAAPARCISCRRTRRESACEAQRVHRGIHCFQRIMNLRFRPTTLPIVAASSVPFPYKIPSWSSRTPGSSGLPVVHPRLCPP